SQPKGTTFKELGINEDELIKDVIACTGVFDTRKSELTTFPLEVSQEIKLDPLTKIVEMPNLKAAGKILVNEHLKKLPKLKAVGSISMENSKIKSIPKLKEAGILIAQNSELKELPALENVGRLCIIDCPIENLKALESASDIFICSSDENNKIELLALDELKEVQKLFVANGKLKSIKKLKKANKVALYNCSIKSVKSTVCKDVEIEVQITDEQLSEKFDTFTDWYNSDILQKSMDLLGNIVNQIKR
ncbi:MAG: hypothetical protein IJW73_09915, partial [Candidatus Gastranaerophilales bacterium]|nr:hypothetical protein [Candidatus Gastranaerophilales bacterium]